MMSEAEILALTYYDKMSVYRPFKDTLPTGESVFYKGLDGKKYMMIYHAPCLAFLMASQIRMM